MVAIYDCPSCTSLFEMNPIHINLNQFKRIYYLIDYLHSWLQGGLQTKKDERYYY